VEPRDAGIDQGRPRISVLDNRCRRRKDVSSLPRVFTDFLFPLPTGQAAGHGLLLDARQLIPREPRRPCGIRVAISTSMSNPSRANVNREYGTALGLES